MPSVKDQVIELIRGLPEESSIDDIMAALYFRLKVDTGLEELDEDKGIPHEELKVRLSRWRTQ